MAKHIAIVRIRGLTGVRKDINDTLTMMNLHRKNYCVVYPESASIRGMVMKVKDFVTFGEIDDATYKTLQEKKGEKDPKDEKKLKKYFRLSPPIGGFERKGTKKPFNLGGALGNRKEKMSELITKMM